MSDFNDIRMIDAVLPEGPAPADGLSSASAAASATAPTARDDVARIRNDRFFSGSVLEDNGFGPDLDPTGEGLAIQEVEGDRYYVSRTLHPEEGGEVRIKRNGAFFFDPEDDYGDLLGGDSVSFSLSYTLINHLGETSTATLTYIIEGTDFAPRLHPDDIYADASSLIHLNVFEANGVAADHDVGPYPDVDAGRGGLQVVDLMGGTVEAGELAELEGGGLLRLMEDGRLWFRPDGAYDHLAPGELATETFTYRVTDGTYVMTSHATVLIQGGTLSAVAPGGSAPGEGAPPQLHADTLYGDAVNLGDINVFEANGAAADTDPEGASLRVLDFMGGTVEAGELGVLEGGGLVRLKANGRLWFRADGAYDHLAPGETVTETFAYRATDGAHVATSRVTLVIQGGDMGEPVASLSDPAPAEGLPPVLHPDILYGDEVTADFIRVFEPNGGARDSDPEGARLEILDVMGGTLEAGELGVLEGGGLIRLLENGKLWFRADGAYDHLRAGETVTETFAYRVTDGAWAATSHASILITGRDSPPQAMDDALSAQEAGAQSFDLFADNGAGADLDPEGETLSVAAIDGQEAAVGGAVALAGGGLIRVQADGSLLFDPLEDFAHLQTGESETVSFAYTIRDGSGAQDTALAQIEVQGATRSEVLARDDHFALSEDGVGTFDLLANDYDAPDAAPTLLSVSFAGSGPGDYAGPLGGVLTLEADGRSVSFDSDGDFDHLDLNQTESFAFDYEVEDAGGAVTQASAEITVLGRADAPRPQDDHFIWSLSGGEQVMNVFADNGNGVDAVVDQGDALQVLDFKPSSYSQTREAGSVLNIPGGGTVRIDADGDLFLTASSEDQEWVEGGELAQGAHFTVDYRLEGNGADSAFAQVTIDVIF